MDEVYSTKVTGHFRFGRVPKAAVTSTEAEMTANYYPVRPLLTRKSRQPLGTIDWECGEAAAIGSILRVVRAIGRT